ncbi:MAG: family 43 glycosylhydrolase, partial [Candidatus Latescibacterota bacterium]
TTKLREKRFIVMQKTFLIAILLIALGCAAPAQALVKFDFEQKFFTEIGTQVKDHSVIRIGDEYHLFYLRGAPAIDVGHAVSQDLIRWEQVDPVLYVEPDAWDNWAIWAPQIIRDPDGEGFIMYYTGVNNKGAQQSGIALAADMYNWMKLPWPVYHPDPSWAIWDETFWSHGRDPFVFYHNGLFFQLLTAKTIDGMGAIACGVSMDGFAWQDVGPLYVHHNWHVLESIQCIERNDIFYLFYTEEVVHGTSYMMSDNLLAGWDGTTSTLIDFGHAPEINQFDEGTYIMSRHSIHQDVIEDDVYVIRYDTLRWSGDLPYVYRPWPLNGDWNLVYGNAFLYQPTFLNNPRNRGDDVDVGYEGHCWLSSYERYQGPLGIGSVGSYQGNSPVGMIRSKTFTVAGNSMNLLVGGGNYPDQCYVALVNASTQDVLYKETGNNSYELDRRFWDLRPYIGEQVYVEISDGSTSTFGFISCDDITESFEIVSDDSTTTAGEKGKRQLEQVVSDSGSKPLPELFQNSPNPFNPTTTISYHLPVTGRVVIDVFDVRGKQIRRLRDRTDTAGTYHVQWDGTNGHGEALSSGIYFYRLGVDGQTISTKKMILVK